MTVDNPQAISRPAHAGRMLVSDPFWIIDDDGHPSPSGDHEWGIYASSPNSLHMYDQEKADMQCSYGSPVCGVNNSMLLNDDFDLKTQYETSQDICLPVCSPAGMGKTATSTVTSEEISSWSDSKTPDLLKVDNIFQSDKQGLGSDPTLAELNLDESLLDEIENIINIDAAQMGNSAMLEGGMGVCVSNLTRQVIPPPSKPETSVANSRTLKTECPPQIPTNSVPQIVPAFAKQLVTPPVKAEVVGSVPCRGRHQSLPQLAPPAVKYGNQTSGAATVVGANQTQSALHRLLLQSRANVSATQASLQAVPQQASSPSRKRKPASAGLDARAVEQKWEEIKQFIDDDPPKSVIKRERLDSDRSSILTSNDEIDSDDAQESDDSDHGDWEDYMSFGESDNSQDAWPGDTEGGTAKRKRKQYFWQYNLQSKGPKGTKVKFNINEPDPHKVHGFEDPVFDPTTSSVAGVAVGIRHGGKARKGDGNDISPNPRKLCQIGLQIKKLTRQINDFAPVMELPVSARNRSRKEKNKLASRACRLKKKAQHEANKVKLYGLDQEHGELMSVIEGILPSMMQRINTLERNGKTTAEEDEKLTKTLENSIKEHMSTMVAGNTAEFVNSVIKKVEEGDPKGGIK